MKLWKGGLQLGQPSLKPLIYWSQAAWLHQSQRILGVLVNSQKSGLLLNNTTSVLSRLRGWMTNENHDRKTCAEYHHTEGFSTDVMVIHEKLNASMNKVRLLCVTNSLSKGPVHKPTLHFEKFYTIKNMSPEYSILSLLWIILTKIYHPQPTKRVLCIARWRKNRKL